MSDEAVATPEKPKVKRARVRAKVDPIAALRSAAASIAEHRKAVEKVIAFHQGKIDEARDLLEQFGPQAPDPFVAPKREVIPAPNSGTTLATKTLVKLPNEFSMDLAKKRGLLPINIAQLVRRGVIRKVDVGQYSKVA